MTKKIGAYVTELTDVAERIRRNTIFECIDVSGEEADQIYKLLHNGQTVFQLANGARFDKLYYKRQALWDRHYKLQSLIEKLYSLTKENRNEQ